MLRYLPALVFVVSLTNSTSGAIYYRDGAVHDVSTALSGNVLIQNETTLNLLAGGAVNTTGLGVKVSEFMTRGDMSAFNLNGGSVTTSGTGTVGVETYASSTVSLNSGLISVDGLAATNLRTRDNSSATITGGTYNTSGTGGRNVHAFGGGTTSILGGEFSTTGFGGMSVLVQGGGQVDIHGGTFRSTTWASEGVFVLGNGLANVFGGLFLAAGDGLAVQGTGATINVFGTNFNHAFGHLTPEAGMLSGTLQDGTDINVRFNRIGDGTNIVLMESPEHVQTPEPASIAIWSLFGLVGLGYARRRRRSNSSVAQG